MFRITLITSALAVSAGVLTLSTVTAGAHPRDARSRTMLPADVPYRDPTFVPSRRISAPIVRPPFGAPLVPGMAPTRNRLLPLYNEPPTRASRF